MPKYELDAGRAILKDGKPFISIQRDGDTLPTEADDMAAIIVVWLRLYAEGAAPTDIPRKGLYRDDPQPMHPMNRYMFGRS